MNKKKKKVNIPYSGLHLSGECKDTGTWPRTGYTATVHTATILPLSVAVTQSVASEASQQVLDRLRFYYQDPHSLHILAIHHGVVKWKHTSPRGI